MKVTPRRLSADQYTINCSILFGEYSAAAHLQSRCISINHDTLTEVVELRGGNTAAPMTAALQLLTPTFFRRRTGGISPCETEAHLAARSAIRSVGHTTAGILKQRYMAARSHFNSAYCGVSAVFVPVRLRRERDPRWATGPTVLPGPTRRKRPRTHRHGDIRMEDPTRPNNICMQRIAVSGGHQCDSVSSAQPYHIPSTIGRMPT